MDRKTQKNIQEKLTLRVNNLPPIFQKFLEEKRPHLSLSSRFEYSKDFTLFIDYLQKYYPSETIDDSFIFDLDKQIYVNFLKEVSHHTRSFQTTAAHVTEQKFENSYSGISRKQYALNHFLRYLDENRLIKQPISLLGTNSQEETREIVSAFLPAELFQQLDLLFIPKNGFKTSREATFEKKNRARNCAILSLFLYCGLKVHEIVELKQKDLQLDSQSLALHRKKNRLNTVPIPDEAMLLLQHYLATQANSPDSFFFRSSHDQQISPRTIRQILSKVVVYPDLSPELLRKTYQHYVTLFLGDPDCVNYLSGKRYRYAHDARTIAHKMYQFSYKNFS
ncbi:MAG: tyrosine-type recombinase/integrase [Enterococcus sp.]